MNGSTSGNRVVFRGWVSESEDVMRTLTALGIAAEMREAIVPAIIGGSLIVCEVSVSAVDFTAAQRLLASVVGECKLRNLVR
jgi:hypothetical protein